MIGDRLPIKEHHTRCAGLIADALAEALGGGGKLTLSVAGESGAGAGARCQGGTSQR